MANGCGHEGGAYLTIGPKLESSTGIINVLQVGIAAAASCERLFRPLPRWTTQMSSGLMKRPRGLWKSQRSSGKPSPSELRPEDGTPNDDGDTDVRQPAKRPKRDGSDEHDGPGDSRRVERAAADVEDWDDLKELFNDVIEKYEGAHIFSLDFSMFFSSLISLSSGSCRRHSNASSAGDELTEAVELLRGVIHECNRLLRLHPDPSVIFMPSSPPRASPGLGRMSPGSSVRRDWGNDIGSPGHTDVGRIYVDRPTAFHYMYGTALFLLGKIISAEPSLAKDGEPAGSPAFYLAALDVFEMGENLPKRWDEHGSSREDWRMAIVWGRCLVCLADEKISRMENTTHGMHTFRPVLFRHILNQYRLLDFQLPVLFFVDGLRTV
jgi:hypothetical protein